MDREIIKIYIMRWEDKGVKTKVNRNESLGREERARDTKVYWNMYVQT